MVAIKKRNGLIIKRKDCTLHVDIIVKEDLYWNEIESCGFVNDKGIYYKKYDPIK